MALVMLGNNFSWAQDRGTTFILCLFNISVAFDTTDHDILLEMELTVLWGLPLFSRGRFQATALGYLRVAFNIHVKQLGEVIRMLMAEL